jgi:hypothetical protein
MRPLVLRSRRRRRLEGAAAAWLCLVLAGCAKPSAPTPPRLAPAAASAATPVAIEKRIVIAPKGRLPEVSKATRRALQQAAERLRRQVDLLHRQVEALRDGIHHHDEGP